MVRYLHTEIHLKRFLFLPPRKSNIFRACLPALGVQAANSLLTCIHRKWMGRQDCLLLYMYLTCTYLLACLPVLYIGLYLLVNFLYLTLPYLCL